MSRQHRDDVCGRRRSCAAYRSKTERGPDQKREDDILGLRQTRKADEANRADHQQRRQQNESFGHIAATQGRAACPHEQQRRDDQCTKCVAEPPDPPERGKSGRLLHASRAE